MTFQKNEIRKNHTIGEHGGGEVYVKNGEGNDFGPSGSLTFTENNLIENSAITEGGGIYVYQTQSILITDNQVKLNTSGLEGGGIYLYHHGEAMLGSVAISTDPPASMVS